MSVKENGYFKLKEGFEHSSTVRPHHHIIRGDCLLYTSSHNGHLFQKFWLVFQKPHFKPIARRSEFDGHFKITIRQNFSKKRQYFLWFSYLFRNKKYFSSISGKQLLICFIQVCFKRAHRAGDKELLGFISIAIFQ